DVIVRLAASDARSIRLGGGRRRADAGRQGALAGRHALGRGWLRAGLLALTRTCVPFVRHASPAFCCTSARASRFLSASRDLPPTGHASPTATAGEAGAHFLRRGTQRFRDSTSIAVLDVAGHLAGRADEQAHLVLRLRAW